MFSRSTRTSMAKSKQVMSGTSLWWASSSPLNSANAKLRSVSSPGANKAIYVLYMDDSILMGPDFQELDKIIKDMKKVGLDLTVKGDISDFLGISIQHHKDGTVHLTQPHLINSILEGLGLHADNAKAKSTPVASSKLLSQHDDAPPHDESFHYRQIIGKLNHLEKSTQPHISYAMHQCACFSADPKQPHADTVKWLGRYLKGTKDKGMILKPKGTSFDIYINADFVCGTILKLNPVTLPAQDTATSSCMPAAQSSGHHNSKWK